MLKAVSHSDDHPQPELRRRKRRLRSIAMLPTLLTLANLYFGFAAIYCCGREMLDLGAGVPPDKVRTLNSDFFEARAPSFLSIAVWMIVAAMICDALDGRVARKTGKSSKFGEQLDSLADVVSFGVAPAMMMLMLTRREMTQWGYVPFFGRFPQVTFFVASIYVCCAALRLARFNVEATLDETAHKGFKGLPSPGAASGVASLVFLHDHLDIRMGWHHTAEVIAWLMPLATLAVALLMVSRVQYRHAVSTFLRRRPFWHVIAILFVIPILLVYTELTAVALAWVFIAGGPVRTLLRMLKPPQPQHPAVEGAAPASGMTVHPAPGKKVQ